MPQITGSELLAAWIEEVGDDRWLGGHRISYGKFTPFDNLGYAIAFVKSAAAQIKRGAGATCTMYVQVVHGELLKDANRLGMGRWATGHIRAKLIHGHKAHLVNWVYVTGLGIWILDSTFSSNPELSRWVYQVGDDDDGFSGLMM